MKRFKLIQGFAVAIASLGMALPQVSFAAEPAIHAVPDIAMQEGGVLVGQVVDYEGHVQPGLPVAIVQNGVEVTRTTADADGRFAAKGLKGGVYQLVTVNGQSVYRAWSEGTAPPVAQSGATLVTGGQDVVRGQFNGMGFLRNPWVIAGIIATAIAVPIAIHESNSGS